MYTEAVAYKDEALRKLLLETLDTFGPLNENFINHIVAICHYLGEINAGQIRISQSDVYSLKWEANIADLKDEGFVEMIRKGYSQYSLIKKTTHAKKYKNILNELRRMDTTKRRKLALHLHSESTKNGGGTFKIKFEKLGKLV